MFSTYPMVSSESSILDRDTVYDDPSSIVAVESPCRAEGAGTQPGSTLPGKPVVIWWLAAPLFQSGCPGILKFLL